MRVSPEKIYQALYPRTPEDNAPHRFIDPKVMISKRPPKVEDRAIPAIVRKGPHPRGIQPVSDRSPARPHDPLLDARPPPG